MLSFNKDGTKNVKPKYEIAAKALMFELKLEQEAKEKKQKAGELYHRGKEKVFPNQEDLSECHVDEQLAELAEVSKDTIHKVRQIEEKATPEQKEKLVEGTATINQIFVVIKREEVKQSIKEAKWPEGKYRVIYAVEQDIVTVFVLEITPHNY